MSVCKKKNGVTIIAEAGVNHNGDIHMAMDLAKAAAESGADFVKYQTFIPEMVASKFAKKAAYQDKGAIDGDTQLDMIKKLQLTYDEFVRLKLYCEGLNIKFLSTAFDVKSLLFLDRLGLNLIKVPSGEITNVPFLKAVGGLKRRVLLSTGMADLTEVEQALNILTTAGTIRSKITVLQCTTQYPTPFENANLLAMVDMRERLGVQVGYSDHTLGIEASIAAVAMGAQVIEKHFTLDKGLTGPDHSASIEPPELGMLVKSIKNVEMALGQSEKKPTGEEILMRNVARRSIVAGKCIAEGEMLTEENLQIKRPGDGIPPGDLDRIIGTLAIRAFSKDEKIEV